MPEQQNRLNIKLSPNTEAELRTLKTNLGSSITEVVRRAISAYKFIQDEQAAGRIIQTVKSDGSDRRDITII